MAVGAGAIPAFELSLAATPYRRQLGAPLIARGRAAAPKIVQASRMRCLLPYVCVLACGADTGRGGDEGCPVHHPEVARTSCSMQPTVPQMASSCSVSLHGAYPCIRASPSNEYVAPATGHSLGHTPAELDSELNLGTKLDPSVCLNDAS